ncbi:MAG: hypothetical protein ACK4ZW_05745 [Blastomonas sp.]
MTHAQLREIRAALMDIKGWLRETLDASVFLLMLLVCGIVLFNLLRPVLL